MKRRNFLKNSLQASASAILWESFFSSVLNKAFAQDIQSGNYYVHLSMAGGPPRWMFDLPTNPWNKADDFIQGGFGMSLNTSGTVATPIYAHYPYQSQNKTYHLPPVWRNHQNLLANTVMFRGLDAEINSHLISNTRQVAPVIGGLSINGAIADQSTLPLPAAISSGRYFKSNKSINPVTINNHLNTSTTTNPVKTILQPFSKFAPQTGLDDANMARIIAQTQNAFDQYANQLGIGPNSLRDSSDRALSMIQKNMVSLAEQWSAVFEKYLLAVSSALSYDEITKLYKTPIKADGSVSFNMVNSQGATIAVKHNDIRDLFKTKNNIGPDIAQLAARFATAEILIINDLTSTVSISLDGLSNFSLDNVIPGVDEKGIDLAPKNFIFNFAHDQHGIGSVPSTLVTTAFYQAVLNCTQIFVSSMKNKGIFNRMVIHFASEFNRTPRLNGSGSDHGFYGSSACIMSGMIEQYGLLGNIYKNGRSGSDSYHGTWGRAAPTNVSPGVEEPIKVQDIALTICSMLSTAPVSSNGYVLLDRNRGWAPLTRGATNV